MEKYSVKAGDINRLIQSRFEKSRVIVPRREESGTIGLISLADAEESINLSKLVDEFRPRHPLKTFLMPPREKVATFPARMEVDVEQKYTLFGFKACSSNHIRLLDNIMLDSEWPDDFYRQRKENMLLITCDCVEVRETCFCTEVGLAPHPTTGNFDLNIARVNENFIIEVGSEKGRTALAELDIQLEEATDPLLERLEEKRTRTADKVAQQNEEYGIDENIHEAVRNNRDADVYPEKAGDCVECGGCNLVCTSCYCFFIADRPEGEEAFERFRVWDSCQYTSYARMGGGENPREYLFERVRHRIAHKYDYLKESFDFYGCTGCGRCIDTCPADIDIRELLQGAKQ